MKKLDYLIQRVADAEGAKEDAERLVKEASAASITAFEAYLEEQERLSLFLKSKLGRARAGE